MITPSDRINENEKYKKNCYVDGENLICTFCKYIINHKNKFLLDQHLNTSKHKANKYKKKTPQETNQPTSTSQEEHKIINIDLVYALTQANISLEKIDKLKLFLLKYCKN
ncbi:9308_t:CDS:1, partial [Racocetra persica]